MAIRYVTDDMLDVSTAEEYNVPCIGLAQWSGLAR
jgi:hypothetical protein